MTMSPLPNSNSAADIAATGRAPGPSREWSGKGTDDATAAGTTSRTVCQSGKCAGSFRQPQPG